MYQLRNKRILLGVTGGIAAYKAALLVRLLRLHGAEVRVVMTRNACKFITPLTMQSLSANPVHNELLDLETESAMGHIDLARWADAVIVAPASANFIARYVNGFAGDLLSTLCLATDAPVLLAPAMNRKMWLNVATQENVERLKQRGVGILGPGLGDQACGETGLGRMLEPEEVANAVAGIFATGLLTGLRLLVTAGPTREAIDPVRYISNRSSGRMGFAIANAAIDAGADVSIICGPVSIPKPERASNVEILSAADMRNAVMQHIGGADIFVSVAAVADYGVETISEQKIKKPGDEFQLRLKKNPDILAEVATLEKPPFTVGFAAETENLEQNAQSKLEKKKLDIIVANLVGETTGFDAEENVLTVFWPLGMKCFKRARKDRLARYLIEIIAKRYYEKNSNKAH